MNIIKIRQEEREHKLRDIQSSLQKAIDEGQNINYKKTIMAICSNLYLSENTAKHYLNIVLFRMNLTKEDLEKIAQ